METIPHEIEIFFKIKKYKTWKVIAASLALIIILGTTDYLTGYELSFSFFYLIPISIVVIYANRKAGLIISLLSACAWVAADIVSEHTYTNLLIPFWNGLMRLGYFVVHSLLLAWILDLYHTTKMLSLIDPLTKLPNYRFFHETFKRELHKAERTNLPLTLAYFDLDNFKTMNDLYGHLIGDDLLKLIAGKIPLLIRPQDMFARVGGDEFILLLPETDSEHARTAIERIRFELARSIHGKNWPVTLSIGAVTFHEHYLTIQDMIKRADLLMYQVKQKGKNNAEFSVFPET